MTSNYLLKMTPIVLEALTRAEPLTLPAGTWPAQVCDGFSASQLMYGTYSDAGCARNSCLLQVAEMLTEAIARGQSREDGFGEKKTLAGIPELVDGDMPKGLRLVLEVGHYYRSAEMVANSRNQIYSLRLLCRWRLKDEPKFQKLEMHQPNTTNLTATARNSTV